MLYVRITDYDWYNGDDHVGNIYVPINLNPGESIQRDTYAASYGRLELSIQLTCQPNFFGKKCSTFCNPVDIDGRGHFICGPQGERICRNGWRDPGNHCLTRKQFHTLQMCKLVLSVHMQRYVKTVTPLAAVALHQTIARKRMNVEGFGQDQAQQYVRLIF